MAKTYTGRVKWFDNEKGFGFIEYKEGESIFVHYSVILNYEYKILNEGDIVEFALVNTDKGYETKKILLKTSNKLEYLSTKEKIEMLGTIASVVSAIIAMLPNNDFKIKNQININCKNCEINIIEKLDDVDEAKNKVNVKIDYLI
ncbi:MAG: cold shock domain-containing protein [Mollicutes bacterium]|nr:cold shock domain-containing protein [Mollicutes bacterium]